MRKLVVGTFVSVDGVMQAPGAPDEDRSGGFEHGGWLVPHVDEAFGAAMVEWIDGMGALLLGRRTYELFASHWPRVTDDDPIAAKINGVPRYVASTTLSGSDWDGTTILSGDVPAAVAALKRREGGEIQVHGSGELVQTLMRHELVDEFRLLVAPVLIGSGRRLFGDGTMPAGLELVGVTAMPSGVTLHVYRRAGRLEYGSVALAT